jgi:hypothetical protein
MRKRGQMAHDLRDEHIEAMLDKFIQSKSMDHSQDYIARGRRFSTFDVGQLSEDWIMATRSWLTHKETTTEQIMDDLTSELRLRGLQPPYEAIKQELKNRSTTAEESERKKARREVARKIAEFMRDKKRPLN